MAGAKITVLIGALVLVAIVSARFFPRPPAPDDCLTPSQLESHPMYSSEKLIAEEFAASGPAIEVYRGHTRDQVLAFAEQNDSGAMVVLGAMAMVRARGENEDRALDYLDVSDTSLREYKFDQLLTEEQKVTYQEAHDWFYKAALHGRFLALSNAGEALLSFEPNPIKGGWIGRAEYDALDRQNKSAFNVQGIYNSMMRELAGNPSQGFLSMILNLQLRSSKLDEVAAIHADRFRDDARKAELPPLVIPESTMPSTEEIQAMICK